MRRFYLTNIKLNMLLFAMSLINSIYSDLSISVKFDAGWCFGLLDYLHTAIPKVVRMLFSSLPILLICKQVAAYLALERSLFNLRWKYDRNAIFMRRDWLMYLLRNILVFYTAHIIVLLLEYKVVIQTTRPRLLSKWIWFCVLCAHLRPKGNFCQYCCWQTPFLYQS